MLTGTFSGMVLFNLHLEEKFSSRAPSPEANDICTWRAETAPWFFTSTKQLPGTLLGIFDRAWAKDVPACSIQSFLRNN